jgi:hypothetical protein
MHFKRRNRKLFWVVHAHHLLQHFNDLAEQWLSSLFRGRRLLYASSPHGVSRRTLSFTLRETIMPLQASSLLQHHEQHISFVGSGVANCRGHISWLRLLVWRTYGIEHIRFDEIAYYANATAHAL